MADKKDFIVRSGLTVSTNATINTAITVGNSSVNTVANSTSVSTSNLIITTIVANGSVGTANQVLTTNGSGVYWANSTGGGGTAYNSIYLQYTSNGSNTTYSIPGGYAANSLAVYLNGALLRNGSDVDVSSGTSIVFTEAPPNGSLIDIIGQSTIYANNISSVVNQQFTANGTANSFTVTNGYIPNTAIVFVNGVKQLPGTDVVTTSGSTINFATPPANGYSIDVYAYQGAVVQSNTALTVGNTVIGLNQISIGNSSVNTQIVAGNVFLNGSTLVIGNNASNVTINNNSITIGTQVINSTSISINTIATNTFTIGTATYFVANGNLGIGNSSPTGKLHVTTSTNNTIRLQTAAHETLTNLSAAITFSRGSDGIAALSGIMGWNNGGIAISGREGIVLATGGADSYSNTAEVMRIGANGNVGVGTSSPGYKLHTFGTVNTAIRVGVENSSSNTSATAEFIAYLSGAANTPYVQLIQASSYSSIVSTGSNNPFRIVVNGSERVRVAANGNVGIGTSTPIAKTSVSSNVGTVQFTWSDDTNGTARLDTASGLSRIWTNVGLGFGTGAESYTERVIITSTGRVGVGTSSPAYPLHISGSNTTISVTQATGTGSNSAIVISIANTYASYLQQYATGESYVYTSGTQMLVGTSVASPLTLFTNNSIKMTISPSGIVTKPYQPVFYAYGSTTQNWTGTYNQQILQLNTQRGLGSRTTGYNTSTYRFTAPATGTYLFLVKITSNVAASGPVAFLFVNGVSVTETSITYGVSYHSSFGTFCEQLNAGDYVEVYGGNYNNTTFGLDLSRCTFSGFLIG